MSQSKAMYDTLHKAFDYFNKHLFNGELDPCIIVVHRKRNAHGYFWKDQWQNGRKTKDLLSEIALNPESMGRNPKEWLSTLVHEMVHHWDAQFNEVPSYGHGKLWAAKMDDVGLTPTSTGKKGGKRTGRRVTHMIEKGGPFDVTCDKFLALKGTDVSWWSPPQSTIKKRDTSKVKHTCPCCDFNAWFKEGGRAYCGNCEDEFGQPILLEAKS